MTLKKLSITVVFLQIGSKYRHEKSAVVIGEVVVSR